MRQRSAEAHLIPTSPKRPSYTTCVERRCSKAKERSFTPDELGFVESVIIVGGEAQRLRSQVTSFMS